MTIKKFKTDTTKMGRQYITKVLNLQTKESEKNKSKQPFTSSNI